MKIEVELEVQGQSDMRNKHIEFINDYIIDGDDFLFNDNKGKLIRCKDCIYRLADDWCERLSYPMYKEGFCSHGTEKDW